MNFRNTIRYKVSGAFFRGGGRGSRKFWPEAEILGIFSIEVAPWLPLF